MKALKRQRALIPCVILLGFVNAGAALAERHFLQGPTDWRTMRAAGGHDRLGNRRADVRSGDTGRHLEHHLHWAVEPDYDGSFPWPGAEGKNAPVVIWLSTQGNPPANPITGSATLTPDQAKQFSAGEWYVNVHTQSHPAGEIRGQVIPPKS